MAVAFDTYTSSEVTGTSNTYSHTCTGTSLALLVAVIGAQSGTGDVITGVTYNGVAMTKLQTLAPGSGSDRYRYLFYLKAPADGANNVVISASSSTFIGGYSGSYTGVDQSSANPDSSNQGTSATSASFSQATTVVASNCWLVAFVTNDAVNVTASTGTTDRSGLSTIRFSDSNGTVGTGSQSLAWTGANGTGTWGAVIASIAPDGSGRDARKLSLLGVG